MKFEAWTGPGGSWGSLEIHFGSQGLPGTFFLFILGYSSGTPGGPWGSLRSPWTPVGGLRALFWTLLSELMLYSPHGNPAVNSTHCRTLWGRVHLYMLWILLLGFTRSFLAFCSRLFIVYVRLSFNIKNVKY